MAGEEMVTSLTQENVRNRLSPNIFFFSKKFLKRFRILGLKCSLIKLKGSIHDNNIKDIVLTAISFWFTIRIVSSLESQYADKNFGGLGMEGVVFNERHNMYTIFFVNQRLLDSKDYTSNMTHEFNLSQ